MTYENINLKLPNMTIVGDSFFTIDDTLDIMFEKTCDGDIIFSYPFEVQFGNEAKELVYDGNYFWSMENGTLDDYDITIKKWYIENYMCKLKKEFNFIGDANDRYSSDTFALEHYHTSFAATVSGGSTYVCVNDYYNDTIEAGVVLDLGPNSAGEYEEVTVTGTCGNTIGLNFFTSYTYDKDDPINFSKNIWLFNNYNGVDSVGALYKFNSHDGQYTTMFADSKYKSILASTFAIVDNGDLLDNVDALLYVSGSTVRFVDVSTSTLELYDALAVENIKINGVTLIPIYIIEVFNNSLYRIQLGATYYGADYVWSNYNYQLTPLRSFVDSIVVNAYPVILPANGVNASTITAVIQDQYATPVRYKPVTFTDTDVNGFITVNPVYTGSDGMATTYYKAGITVNSVTVEGTVTQFD